MKISALTPNRHLGESRGPLSKRNLSGGARVERILWAPAFAGVTDYRALLRPFMSVNFAGMTMCGRMRAMQATGSMSNAG
jgi:hypothetical protein